MAPGLPRLRGGGRRDPHQGQVRRGLRGGVRSPRRIQVGRGACAPRKALRPLSVLRLAGVTPDDVSRLPARSAHGIGRPEKRRSPACPPPPALGCAHCTRLPSRKPLARRPAAAPPPPTLGCRARSNIDAAISVGTIFGIYRAHGSKTFPLVKGDDQVPPTGPLPPSLTRLHTDRHQGTHTHTHTSQKGKRCTNKEFEGKR